MTKVEQVLSLSCVLGEGCVWDADEKCLYFVDITMCMIYSWYPKSSLLKEYRADEAVGCIVPHIPGGITAAVGHSLIHMNENLNQESALLHLSLPDFVRYNDGKCDRYGCLWLGTMARDQSYSKAVGCGSLYCIRDNKILSRYDGYTIPNGMAWNQDGSLFYHIDTSTRSIDVYDVGDIGVLTNRRPVIHVAEQDGLPDGMCIDSEGNLWVAMWGGSKVICFNPITGVKLQEIAIPAKYVSCVTFGDEDLKTLYVTTARDEDGNGGQLYAVKLSITGVLPYKYGGRENEK